MKSLKYLMFTLVLLMIGIIQLQSQVNSVIRSKEQFRNFNHFPENFEARKSELKTVFSASVGDSVWLRIHDGILIYGKVTDKVVEENGIQRLNFTSSTYPQTIFNFSSIPSGNETLYRSRIINRISNEVLQLNVTEGKYVFRKTRIDKLIAE